MEVGEASAELLKRWGSESSSEYRWIEPEKRFRICIDLLPGSADPTRICGGFRVKGEGIL